MGQNLSEEAAATLVEHKIKDLEDKLENEIYEARDIAKNKLKEDIGKEGNKAYKNLYKMADIFLRDPMRHRMGKEKLSIRQYLQEKYDNSEFFNSLENLSSEKKGYMMLTEMENMHLFYLNAKMFDTTLATLWQDKANWFESACYLNFMTKTALGDLGHSEQTVDYKLWAKLNDEMANAAIMVKDNVDDAVKQAFPNSKNSDEIITKLQEVKKKTKNYFLTEAPGANTNINSNTANNEIIYGRLKSPPTHTKAMSIMYRAAGRFDTVLKALDRDIRENRDSIFVKDDSLIPSHKSDIEIRLPGEGYAHKCQEIYGNGEKFLEVCLQRDMNFLKFDFVKKGIENLAEAIANDGIEVPELNGKEKSEIINLINNDIQDYVDNGVNLPSQYIEHLNGKYLDVVNDRTVDDHLNLAVIHGGVMIEEMTEFARVYKGSLKKSFDVMRLAYNTGARKVPEFMKTLIDDNGWGEGITGCKVKFNNDTTERSIVSLVSKASHGQDLELTLNRLGNNIIRNDSTAQYDTTKLVEKANLQVYPDPDVSKVDITLMSKASKVVHANYAMEYTDTIEAAKERAKGSIQAFTEADKKSVAGRTKGKWARRLGPNLMAVASSAIPLGISFAAAMNFGSTTALTSPSMAASQIAITTGTAVASVASLWYGAKIGSKVTGFFNNSFAAKGVAAVAGAATMLLTSFTIGSQAMEYVKGQAKQDEEKEKTEKTSKYIQEAASKAPDDVYVHPDNSFIIDASTKAVSEYLGKQNFVEFQKLTTEWETLLPKNSKMVIYENGEEPTLVTAGEDINLKIPAGAVYGADRNDVLTVRLENRTDIEITDSNGNKVSFDEIVSKKSFDDTPNPEIIEQINEIMRGGAGSRFLNNR